MQYYKIKYLLKEDVSSLIDTTINVKGWVRTKRGNKNVAFIALNDGSIITNLQIVVDLAKFDDDRCAASPPVPASASTASW